MNDRTAWLARGGVLCLIALLAVGYVRFNIGLDDAYATCRQDNDVVACDCWRDGYTSERNIFTQAPVFGAFMGLSGPAFDDHMADVASTCGLVA